MNTYKVEQEKTNFKVDIELFFKHFGQHFDFEEMKLIRMHLFNMIREQQRNEGQEVE